MRLGWFSPFPPHRSGIAAYSADALAVLAARHEIDVFVDREPARALVSGHPLASAATVAVRDAHEFPWRHARQPYDLPVYQLGNDTCHHYLWAYLGHYPGLVVLHDAQLHQARARGLVQQHREDDYLAEFTYSHPEADPMLGKLVLAGLGGSLYYFWPMIRIPVEAARLVAVHTPWLARDLAERIPGARVTAIRMGVPDPLPAASMTPAQVRGRHGVPEHAVLFAAYGKVTPEKSLTTLLMALSQAGGRADRAHLLCVGETVDYYDLLADAAALGLGGRVSVTGYVPDDALPSYLAAADVCVCLRWPTSRETSGSWLRCVAAGKPTLVSDLLHLTNVTGLDLRSMTVQRGRDAASDDPFCIMVELIDDVHVLRLALRRLTDDAALRERLGEAARRYWAQEATPEVMARDYERALAEAMALPPPAMPAAWPRHLKADGTARLREIVTRVGVDLPIPL